MKHFFRLFLLFSSIMSTFSLFSCAQQKPKRDKSVPPSARLTLALRAGTYSEVIKSCLPKFELDYNVECSVLELGEDALHSLVANDSANPEGSYDFCMVDGSWMAEYTSKGILQNLSDLGYSLDDDIIPATKEVCYYNGNLYLAPYYGNVTVLLYNKIMIKEAGFTSDGINSIEDILNICKFQKKRHNLGFMYRGDTANNIVVDFLPILCSYGGWVVDKENLPTVDTTEFKKATETYLELIKTGRDAKKEDLIAAIANKAAAVGIGWPGWYTPAKNSSMDYIALSGKANDSAKAYNSNIYGIWTVGIPQNSTNKEYAIKLLSYLLDSEVQKETVWLGGVPCRYSSLHDTDILKAFPQYKEVCEALESGVYRPVIENWSEFYTILGKEMENIIKGKTSIDEGLKEAQRQLEEIR